MPSTRKNTRRMESELLKLQISATSFNPVDEESIISCAASTLILSHELPRVHPVSCKADAREVARAHADSLGEQFDREVFAQILRHSRL
jgi:hypothetical protein